MANPNVQTYDIKAIRADAILTTEYVAGTIINDCENCNQLMIFFQFVKGSLTSLEMKVEFSHDGMIYCQEISESISSGAATMSAKYHQISSDQNGVLSIPVKCSKIKISAKGTGIVTSSSLKIDAIVGVA